MKPHFWKALVAIVVAALLVASATPSASGWMKTRLRSCVSSAYELFERHAAQVAFFSSHPEDHDSAILLRTLRTSPVYLFPEDSTATEFLLNPELHDVRALVVVVLTNGMQPQRRSSDQAFVTLLPEDSAVPVASINTAASSLEAALGRKLYPTVIQAVDFKSYLSQQQLAGGVMRPYAIWDASYGTLLIDAGLLQGSFREDRVGGFAGLLAGTLFSQLASAVQAAVQAGQKLSSHVSVQVLLQALLLAIPAAFAAAPPLWFCILCPAVLGLVAPLAINFGLGELAGLVCTRLQLSDDQCFDLMLGALGLGFVLSLAASVPIFFVCRLMECAHHNATRRLF